MDDMWNVSLHGLLIALAVISILWILSLLAWANGWKIIPRRKYDTQNRVMLNGLDRDIKLFATGDFSSEGRENFGRELQKDIEDLLYCWSGRRSDIVARRALLEILNRLRVEAAQLGFTSLSQGIEKRLVVYRYRSAVADQVYADTVKLAAG